METIKKTIKEDTEQYLLEGKFGLTDHQAHILSVWMAEMTQVEVLNRVRDLSELHKNVVTEYEINRKQFRNFVESMQASSKTILPELMKQGMVHYETNPKTKKRQLKARSTVLTHVVKFLNELDDLCLEFYGNVYKYTDEPKVQTSLFPESTNVLDKV